MLNRLGYWLRETLASLRRNLTLTVAAVLTAAVSLLLLGVALLARQGVGNQLVQWKGGVQFIVFMKADATEDQIQSVRRRWPRARRSTTPRPCTWTSRRRSRSSSASSGTRRRSRSR